MNEPFHVGDVWFIEAITKNPKTKVPVNPAAIACTVYAPSEWDAVNDVATGAGKTVTFGKIGSGIYENSTGVSLTEAGIWRVVVSSSDARFAGIEPDLITVFPL